MDDHRMPDFELTKLELVGAIIFTLSLAVTAFYLLKIIFTF